MERETEALTVLMVFAALMLSSLLMLWSVW